MKYKEFEKLTSPEKLRKDIINLLKNNPMTRKDILIELGVKESKFAQQWNRLKKQEIGLRVFLNGLWYYGLSKDYRTKIDQ